jgi:DNA-binding MarR family transcriptional regulator
MSRSSLKNKQIAPKLSDQVCFALYSTGGDVTQAYSQLLAPHDLSYPQFVVLMGLWQHNGASVTELATIVGLSKGTLTPVLKKLERQGYLERKRVEGNERTMTLRVTEQGDAFAKQARQITEQALCATGLTDKEAEQLIGLCNKIKRNLSVQ